MQDRRLRKHMFSVEGTYTIAASLRLRDAVWYEMTSMEDFTQCK